MLNYKEAQHLLAQQASSFGKEEVWLKEAGGRVLSEKIVADRDYPPFNRSAMDGYAINLADFEKGIRRFEIAETIYAGSVADKTIVSGQCYKIMTGAAVPSGANVVVRREDTVEESHSVVIQINNCRLFQNIARQGEDMQIASEVIGAPLMCEPAVIALLASLGKAKVMVEKLPRVALFTTGNEVVPVNALVGSVQIRNSNYWLLQSLLNKWGIVPFMYEHVLDDKDALRNSLQKALTADIVIMSGGVSAGDADYVPLVLEELGVQKLFHKVAIKPGKPFWCGKLPSGGMVFALPGNPFSCLATFSLFIQHYLRTCFGLPGLPQLHLPLAANRKKKTPLDEFFPVRFLGNPSALQPVALNGSGDIRLGLQAQALALHPASNSDLSVGDVIDCYLLP